MDSSAIHLLGEHGNVALLTTIIPVTFTPYYWYSSTRTSLSDKDCSGLARKNLPFHHISWGSFPQVGHLSVSLRMMGKGNQLSTTISVSESILVERAGHRRHRPGKIDVVQMNQTWELKVVVVVLVEEPLKNNNAPTRLTFLSSLCCYIVTCVSSISIPCPR